VLGDRIMQRYQRRHAPTNRKPGIDRGEEHHIERLASNRATECANVAKRPMIMGDCGFCHCASNADFDKSHVCVDHLWFWRLIYEEVVAMGV
jgi:hypothetical protein